MWPKPDYTYTIYHSKKLIEIVDLNRGGMSVTNGAEDVLDEVQRMEDVDIREYKIIYKDTENQWDTIIPKWYENSCIGVDFKPGID